MWLIQYLIQLIKPIAADERSDDYLVSVLKYFMDQVQTADPDKFKETLETGLLESKEGEIMATLASYLREQGAQIGRQEGRQEIGSTVLHRLLERKFGVVPDSCLELIQKADTNVLLQWAEKVLEADSIEVVFS